jgi:hypothetical protein
MVTNIKLVRVNLNGANLSNATLRSSIIIGCQKADGLVVENANFRDAVIDKRFYEILLNRGLRIDDKFPQYVEKEELQKKLEKRNISPDEIEEIKWSWSDSK